MGKKEGSIVKLLTIFKLTLALVLAMASFLALAPSSAKVSAHEAASDQADAVYSYVAQPGDSYTEISRKAVQTYGAINKVNASQAGIIFAETNLTLAAGSPELNLGQKVEIKESDIHQWVDKAQDLTDAQESAWNYYVQFVNFNTDSVGQPS